jgi:hypothetical protein
MGEASEPTAPETAAKTEHILIDYENVQPSDLALVDSGPFRVKIFLGPRQDKIRRNSC